MSWIAGYLAVINFITWIAYCRFVKHMLHHAE